MRGSVYIACSVDGFIASPTGDVSFLDEFQQNADPAEGDFGFADFLSSVDVLIMGRKSFEKVLSFGKDMWAYGSTRVIVCSRGEVDIPDHLQETVSSSSLPPKELFAKLNEEGHSHAYVDGGTTIQRFLGEGLIHELKITRAPVLLGEGIPLFHSNSAKKIPLQHVETKAFSNGMVMTTYRTKDGPNDTAA